jgi:hypothetical protein
MIGVLHKPQGPLHLSRTSQNAKRSGTTRGVEIYCGQPVELLRYGEGAELISELTAGIASEPGDAQPCSPFLLDEDTETERAATAIIEAIATDIRQRRSSRRCGHAGKVKPVTELWLSLLPGRGHWTARRLALASAVVCRSQEAAWHPQWSALASARSFGQAGQ